MKLPASTPDLYGNAHLAQSRKNSPSCAKTFETLNLQISMGSMRSFTWRLLSNDPLGNLNPELTYDINFRASLKLAEAARTAGVKRFAFSSSCSTYGAGGRRPAR